MKGLKVARLNVCIEQDAYRRLMVNSAMEGLSPGLFLEGLINDHCKAWNLPAPGAATALRKSKRGASVNPVDSPNRQEQGDDVNFEELAVTLTLPTSPDATVATTIPNEE